MIYTNPADAVKALMDLLDRSQRVLLLSHINPDGDAIGSMLAMWHVLRNQGKQPIALASSPIPDCTRVLPGVEHVQVYDHGMSLPESDLICLVDVANLKRVGPMYDDHTTTLMSRPLMIIDHHVTNTGEGKINLIDSHSASCANLIERLIAALEVPMTPDIATCLLMGLITDTQSFQTSSTDTEALRSAARLLEAGADHRQVVHAVYYSNPYSTVHLMGLALGQIQREGTLVWTHISQDMMSRTGAEDEASDSVVNIMQRIEGVRACALFKERQNGETKISLRSSPGIDVATIAKIWEGGGHTQAAGAILPVPPKQAEQQVLPELLKKLQDS